MLYSSARVPEQLCIIGANREFTAQLIFRRIKQRNFAPDAHSFSDALKNKGPPLPQFPGTISSRGIAQLWIDGDAFSLTNRRKIKL